MYGKFRRPGRARGSGRHALPLSRRALWLTSAVVSIALLGVVIAQVDIIAARAIARGIDYRWVAAGIALLLLEGLITAARFRLLARGGAAYGDCVLATAWYVVLLIGLPARLGEFAGIGTMMRFMRERAGAAAASLLFQRLFDLVLLLAILAAVALVTFAEAAATLVVAFAVVSIAVMLLVLVKLDVIAARCARPLLARRHEIWPRRLLRVLLQARGVRRHHVTRSHTVVLGIYTALKWGANLGGVACIVAAVIPGVTAITAVGIGIVYNIAAVIPIQTVGGFGVTEVVLLGAFRTIGYDAGTGAPIAIAIRLALLCGPLIFWCLSLATIGGYRAVVAQGQSA